MKDDARLIRIEDKLDEVSKRLGSIDSTLAAQHVTLEEHTRRSTNLETIVLPLVKHDNMLMGALKLIGFLGILVGIAEGILQILH